MTDASELKKYATHRIAVTTRLMLNIVFDALLFGLWVCVAWVVHLTAEYFASLGLHPWAATAFEYCSQGSTLVMTVIWIVRDLVEEILEARKSLGTIALIGVLPVSRAPKSEDT